ncbi:hypothetical protein [Nocardia alni]|uniref:hypothetical protein n=1 Tax=Nocardia alni TaxID=2815723 RepID=UPI001C248272|nr:hypothetical protein [Nocardia alni]
MLCGGVIVVVVASAGCMLAPDDHLARGAGHRRRIVLPATLALIPHLFTDESARGRATVSWVGTGAAHRCRG